MLRYESCETKLFVFFYFERFLLEIYIQTARSSIEEIPVRDNQEIRNPQYLNIGHLPLQTLWAFLSFIQQMLDPLIICRVFPSLTAHYHSYWDHIGQWIFHGKSKRQTFSSTLGEIWISQIRVLADTHYRIISIKFYKTTLDTECQNAVVGDEIILGSYPH